MGAASGVIAGVNAVSSIASKNSQKRREREQAASQAYYAQKKYESEKLSLDAQKQFADQQSLIQQLQLQGSRIQEDYALKEQDLQNIIQAANMRFQNQQQLLQSQTQAEQLRAEGDKTKFGATQQKNQMKAQALQESAQQSNEMSGQLMQVEQAIQKGDFEQAAMLAMFGANGQDSSSMTSNTLSRNMDAEQALMGLRSAMESGRLSEQDALSMAMSDEFGLVLERLGIMQGNAQQRQADTNERYATTLSQANAYNINNEENLSRTTSDLSKGILAGNRNIQDLTLSSQRFANDLQYQQGLTNAEIERSSGLRGAEQMSRNSKGAGLFDYLNAGYTVYQGAKPLFNNNKSSNVSQPSFNGRAVNGFYDSGFTEQFTNPYDADRANAGLSGTLTQIPGLKGYGY